MRRAALAALALIAAGCGASSIQGGTAEQQIKKSNGAYKKVDCPDKITATQGATFTCTATTAKGEYVVTIEIDSIEDGKAHMTFVSAKKQSH